MPVDFTDEETTALVRLLREAIDGDRFPFSPRVQVLRAVLAGVEAGARAAGGVAGAEGLRASVDPGLRRWILPLQRLLLPGPLIAPAHDGDRRARRAGPPSS